MRLKTFLMENGWDWDISGRIDFVYTRMRLKSIKSRRENVLNYLKENNLPYIRIFIAIKKWENKEFRELWGKEERCLLNRLFAIREN